MVSKHMCSDQDKMFDEKNWDKKISLDGPFMFYLSCNIGIPEDYDLNFA